MQRHFLFCGWHLDQGQEPGVKFSLRWVNAIFIAASGNDCWGSVRYVKLEILKQEFEYSLEEVNRAKDNKSRPLNSIRGSKASNSEAVCHLPARRTVGESVNLKTAHKLPYLSLQIWWIILASIIFFVKQSPLWRCSRNLPRQHVWSLNIKESTWRNWQNL